jgi:uncharacterized protein YdaU (DUF1376 family)
MTLPYYPFYWGDYSAKTFNLTTHQHGVYMLLLRHIYCTGERIPVKHRLSIAKARLPEEGADVDFILETYFVRIGDEWTNERAEQVMGEQYEKHQKLVNAGKKGGIASKPPLKPGLSQAEATLEASLKPPPKQPEPEPEPKEVRKKEPTVLSKEKRGTRLPDDFEPDHTCHELAEKLLLSREASQDAFQNFMDYWRGVPGAKGLKLDWQATFRNKLRHDAKTGKTNARKLPATNTFDSSFAIVKAGIEAERAEIERLKRLHGIGGEDAPELPRLRQVSP